MRKVDATPSLSLPVSTATTMYMLNRVYKLLLLWALPPNKLGHAGIASITCLRGFRENHCIDCPQTDSRSVPYSVIMRRRAIYKYIGRQRKDVKSWNIHVPVRNPHAVFESHKLSDGVCAWGKMVKFSYYCFRWLLFNIQSVFLKRIQL